MVLFEGLGTASCHTGIWRKIPMTARGQNGLAAKPRIRCQGDPATADRIDLLETVDMHSLSLEVGLLFDLGAGVIEGLRRNHEVHMRFINTVEKFSVVESTVDEVEL
jgi:hypothetical protein